MAALTVWKYPITPEIAGLGLPQGARPLTVQVQDGTPQMCVLVDPDAPLEERVFRVAGTGHEITEPVGQHIGTFQMHGGALIFHVFEIEKGA